MIGKLSGRLGKVFKDRLANDRKFAESKGVQAALSFPIRYLTILIQGGYDGKEEAQNNGLADAFKYVCVGHSEFNEAKKALRICQRVGVEYSLVLEVIYLNMNFYKKGESDPFVVQISVPLDSGNIRIWGRSEPKWFIQSS